MTVWPHLTIPYLQNLSSNDFLCLKILWTNHSDIVQVIHISRPCWILYQYNLFGLFLWLRDIKMSQVLIGKSWTILNFWFVFMKLWLIFIIQSHLVKEKLPIYYFKWHFKNFGNFQFLQTLIFKTALLGPWAGLSLKFGYLKNFQGFSKWFIS